jgi:hypothetical protein
MTPASSLSRLVIGTAQFGTSYGIANGGGQVPRTEVDNILSYALAQGIASLDTAVGYGESEAILGDIGVGQFDVVTKLPPMPADVVDIKKWVADQVSGCLARLKQESLYGLLLHRSHDLQGAAGSVLADELSTLKKQGCVEKIGVSIYNPSKLESVVKVLELDLIQAPLNLVDRRLVTSGWLDRLKQLKVEVHTRSAFLQGLLLMPRGSIPSQFERWAGLWDSWAEFLQTQNVSPLAACLSYPLAQPQVDRVVVGVDSLAQLKALVDAATQPPIAYDCNFMSSDDEQLINPSRWSEL